MAGVAAWRGDGADRDCSEGEQRTARYVYGEDIDLRQYQTPSADRAVDEEVVLFAHHLLLADGRGREDIAEAIEKVVESASELGQAE